MVVDGFELSGGSHAQLSVEPTLVEPVEVFQGGELHVLQSAPRTVFANQLGLVETVEGFGQGVVVTVAPGTHRGNRPSLGQALGVAHGRVLNAPVGVVHQSLQLLAAAAPDSHLQGVQGQVGAAGTGIACQPTTNREKTSTMKAR